MSLEVEQEKIFNPNQAITVVGNFCRAILVPEIMLPPRTQKAINEKPELLAKIYANQEQLAKVSARLWKLFEENNEKPTETKFESEIKDLPNSQKKIARQVYQKVMDIPRLIAQNKSPEKIKELTGLEEGEYEIIPDHRFLRLKLKTIECMDKIRMHRFHTFAVGIFGKISICFESPKIQNRTPLEIEWVLQHEFEHTLQFFITESITKCTESDMLDKVFEEFRDKTLNLQDTKILIKKYLHSQMRFEAPAHLFNYRLSDIKNQILHYAEIYINNLRKNESLFNFNFTDEIDFDQEFMWIFEKILDNQMEFINNQKNMGLSKLEITSLMRNRWGNFVNADGSPIGENLEAQ